MLRRLLIGYVVVALVTALSTWQILSWRYDARRTRALERQKAEIVAQLSRDHAKALAEAQAREVVRIEYRTIREEVRDAEVVVECAAPADFERLWNRASRATHPAR